MTVFFDRECKATVAGLEVVGGKDGLRIDFQIERSLKKEPNNAHITVYNLNAEHRQQLQRASWVPVTFEAGYIGSTSVLFQGDLRYAYSEPTRGGTWLTTITSGDGEKASRGSRTHRTGRANTRIKKIAEDLAKDLGVGVGNLSEHLTSAISKSLGDAFGEGVNFSGRAEKALESVLGAVNKSYSIQNNELQVLDIGQPLSGTAVSLSPGKGGVVGIPVVDNKGRVSFTSLLRSDLEPGVQAKISKSSVANGEWRIDSVRYTGDTHKTEWYAECEGKRL